MSDKAEFVITNGRPEIGCQKSGVQEYLLMASSATNVAPYQRLTRHVSVIRMT